MRKSNLTKILVAILTFSLLLGAIVGITTAADEGDVYLENADVERNVQYESQTYLLYRVKKSAIKEEDKATLCMQIASTDGSIVGAITPKEDGDYYVFVTQGVPAKEINTKEVVTVMSGSKAISPAITWSVEDYLYARLYADKYADVTEGGKAAYGVDDGLDFERRQLYYDLLKYGVEAQKLLAPDAEDKIGDSAFVFADDALATYGKFDEPTKITLRYDASKTPTGEIFLGWQYSMYDSFGEFVKTGYAADKSVITAEGYVKARPVYQSEFLTHSYIDFNDGQLPATVGSSITATHATAGIVDGKYVVNQHTSDHNSHVFVGPNTTVAEANAVVFETDISINFTGSGEVGYFYVAEGFGASGSSSVYWAYLKASSDGYIVFDREFVRPASGNVDKALNIKTPIKTDGTPSKLRVVFHEAPWGEEYLELYADGVLFHSTANYNYQKYHASKTPVKATAVKGIGMNFASGVTGIMSIDNVAMTQCVLPEFERIGADDTVVDFDASRAGVTPTITSTEGRATSYVMDAKTGNSYILLTKLKTGNSTGGVGFDIPVTYTAANADLAVLSFDYYMESNVTRMDNQIYVAHNKYLEKSVPAFNNNTSPVMVALKSSPNSSDKGKWIHIEIYYEVLERDENGLVTKVLQSSSTDKGYGISISTRNEDTGIFAASKSYFKLLGNPGGVSGGGIDIPEVGDLAKYRIQLNNSAYGDVRFDNISFKLINKADK